MSLSAVLRTIGKDLSHVGEWIDMGLQVAMPVVDLVDPPLGIIFTEADKLIEALLPTAQGKFNEGNLKQIVAAIATLETMKAGAAAATVTAGTVKT